ncbi:MAG: glycosyl transferase family 2, partial [Verrucomicrobiota bacterium]|nr:glycosyl transferase family 2 [Verrucomicrobiota bacterium]
LMEDVDFSRRLRHAGRRVVLDPPIASSPRHHRRVGPWRASLRNGLMITLFHLGASPEALHAWYYRDYAPE